MTSEPNTTDYAEQRTLYFRRTPLDRCLDVCMPEIVSLEPQGLIEFFGKCIGETISKSEARLVPSFPEVAVRLARKFRLI